MTGERQLKGVELQMKRQRRWCFECPECQFDHHEAGSLATDDEVHCLLCLEDSGHAVALRRWLPAAAAAGIPADTTADPTSAAALEALEDARLAWWC